MLRCRYATPQSRGNLTFSLLAFPLFSPWLTSSSNMLREWYDLCLCGNHSKPIVDFCIFFFTNLLASPGKWESVFSFSSTAKTNHLDKSFSVMLSFKFLFLKKAGRQKLPEGWGHFFTKANSLVWAIFRWYYLDTSGVMSSLFDKVFTCLRTFLDLRQEPVKLSHIFTFIQGRWSLR